MPLLNKRHKETVPISFPKFLAHQSVHEYCTSKSSLKNFFVRTEELDRPGQDPVFHLISCQRILQKSEDNLTKKREWAKAEREKLELQWQDLEDKELKLQDTFKKLSNFIKSNEDKRIRAEKFRQEDYKLRIKRTEDIEELQKNIDLVLGSIQELDANIADLRRYENYLNQVAATRDDFVNANDLISRYEALVFTRHLLGIRQSENLKELENARAKTAKMVEENKFKILGLKNVVADLHSRYNTASREALHWEDIVLDIRRHSYEKYQEIVQVKQSCWNMYQQMCRRKGELQKIPEDDFDSQLMYIKKTMQEIDMVKSRALQACDVKKSPKKKSKKTRVKK